MFAAALGDVEAFDIVEDRESAPRAYSDSGRRGWFNP
jgi:hypothetical protein